MPGVDALWHDGAVNAGEATGTGARAWRSIGRPDAVFAAAFVIVLLPASLLALVQGDRPLPPAAIAAVTAQFAALHVLSFTSIRFPAVSFGVANLVMIALAVLPGSDGVPAAVYPSSAAYLLSFFQIVRHRSRRLGIAALAVGAGGAAIIALMPAVVLEPPARWGLFIGLAALVTATWAVATLQRVRRQQAEDRDRARLRDAIVAERSRINRDLHDVVAHAMTVMIAQADLARADVEADPVASAAAMRAVADTGREALRGMRGIVGAGDAPREPVPGIDDVLADIEGMRSAETATAAAEEGERGRLDAAARIALRFAVREALTNAVRHTAAPRRIDVRMRWCRDRVVIAVVDDGGAGPAGESPGTGAGLVGMLERVRSAGGEVEAGPVEPAGWRVRVVLPLDSADGGGAAA